MHPYPASRSRLERIEDREKLRRLVDTQSSFPEATWIPRDDPIRSGVEGGLVKNRVLEISEPQLQGALQDGSGHRCHLEESEQRLDLPPRPDLTERLAG